MISEIFRIENSSWFGIAESSVKITFLYFLIKNISLVVRISLVAKYYFYEKLNVLVVLKYFDTWV